MQKALFEDELFIDGRIDPMVHAVTKLHELGGSFRIDPLCQLFYTTDLIIIDKHVRVVPACGKPATARGGNPRNRPSTPSANSNSPIP